MRINFFRTPRPRRFSFHTRYYDENKIETEDTSKVEKGSFAKYKNKYRSNPFEKDFDVKERNRKLIIFSIFLGLTALYLFFRGFFIYGAIPGVGSLVAIFLTLKASSNK